MIKRIIGIVLFFSGAMPFLRAQELFPFTEPASNMPARAIGIRLSQSGAFSPFNSRTVPEIMFGINRNLMSHTQVFFSDLDRKYRFEGGSIYLKYRFLSADGAQQHFRMAAFGRASFSERNLTAGALDLEGDSNGWQGGIIATQLLHKLALSFTAGYSQRFGPTRGLFSLNTLPRTRRQLNYSLSTGYLLLPVTYKDYNQPNFNLYAELLGRTDPDNNASSLELAPSLQVIINSKTRIDLGYKFMLSGQLADSFGRNTYLVRAEFNFFNALK